MVIFDFDTEKQDELVEKYMPERLNDIGYENFNSMLTMGSVTVFVFFYFAKVLICFIVLRIKNLHPKIRKYFMGIKKTLYYQDIHILLLEGYIEFLMAMYFNYKYPLFI